MKKRYSFKDLLMLLLIFMKLGVFSFGGGAVMLTLLKGELVDKRKWIDNDELIEMTAIAESTPGPIAINMATYLGYKKYGFFGSLLATLGVVFPSFVIMLILSFVFELLYKFQPVQWAFMGIKCGVIFLILSVSIPLFKGLDKNPFTVILFSLVLIGMIFIEIFSVDFSSIFFILIGACLGLLIYVFSLIKNKKGVTK